MGMGRTNKQVATRLNKSESLMSKWCHKWAWVARARQRDEYIETIKQKAIEDYRNEEAVSLAEKEMEIQHQLLDLRLSALDQGLQMLRYPLVETETTDSLGRAITLRPARWTKNTVRAMYTVASGRGDDIEELVAALDKRLNQHSGVVDISNLSNQEAALLDELLERVEGASGPGSPGSAGRAAQ
jgi:hypothetical protein